MTALKPYPSNIRADTQSLFETLQQIVRLRPQDTQAFGNLANIFIAGRKVNKVPANSADVADTDVIGDVNFTKDFIYSCVSDGSGGSVWRRIAQGAF